MTKEKLRSEFNIVLGTIRNERYAKTLREYRDYLEQELADRIERENALVHRKVSKYLNFVTEEN